ncbi:hypothetical protein BL250_14085 [Erwinia sp. OLTSP20]|nr:hypothetical protein BV501_03455 [Erwinia sp. OAMSP11]PIJ68600.1 hypothetical protein BK416_16270 [Erwinia sp. OLSSP12]PIJ83419.1 hypothetical protein BLD47_04450 [Erwinia sp. OLCASP19]PIJ86252.1 hypothetical protein BLD46_03880 [Erwinia sp. OLMTSP26]PIJ88505.1 hypothetical protein BLD49_01990 [Erwinia sp. OLMDSP33]PIJ90388.1 hypothetical protein BL250_14085 [Erwinia sp. OLTSP20]PIJ94973.1 hypothetical protein BL249_01305 [Erwinia sp. OLFS4]
MLFYYFREIILIGCFRDKLTSRFSILDFFFIWHYRIHIYIKRKLTIMKVILPDQKTTFFPHSIN